MNRIKRIPKEMLFELYINQELSCLSIAQKLNLNVSEATIRNWLIFYNIELRHDTSHKTGPKNHNWKPGIKRRPWGKWGHKAIKVNGKYISEHRYIMEQYLGKPLAEDQVVHHINGDPTDNRIENLQVMTKSTHKTLHNYQDKPRNPNKDPITGRFLPKE